MANALILDNAAFSRFVEMASEEGSDDPWVRAFKKILLGENVDSSLLDYLINLCIEQKEIEDEVHFLKVLQKCLFCVLLLKYIPLKETKSLRAFLSYLLRKSPFRLKAVSNAYFSLIFFLLDEPIDLKIPYYFPLMGNVIEEEKIPHFFLNAELGCILLSLGLLSENEQICKQAFNIACFSKECLDHKGVPFRSLWMRENHHASLVAWLYVLFEGASKMHPSFEQIAETLLLESKIQNKNFLILPILLLHYLNRFALSAPSFDMQQHLFVREYGCWSYRQQHVSAIATFSGGGTSLGAIHKDEVQISAYGPHFLPLGESDKFGIFRSCSGLFNDLFFDEKKVKGWTRSINPKKESPSPGLTWIEHRVEKIEEGFELAARFCPLLEDNRLNFVFFIKAEKAVLERKQLYPKTLEHFFGENTQVDFLLGNSLVSILPLFEGRMQVIPLAGEESHFWGCDFLLAFSIDREDSLYNWIIK